MSDSINNGGPAFPVTLDHRGCVGAYGMFLRDYFAGQALAGLMAVNGPISPNHDAKTCYEMADAMLEARNKEVAP
jgi:hypothetical protein